MRYSLSSSAGSVLKSSVSLGGWLSGWLLCTYLATYSFCMGTTYGGFCFCELLVDIMYLAGGGRWLFLAICSCPDSALTRNYRKTGRPEDKMDGKEHEPQRR